MAPFWLDDANNFLMPLAFALVAIDNDDNREWFPSSTENKCYTAFKGSMCHLWWLSRNSQRSCDWHSHAWSLAPAMAHEVFLFELL
jgi:hypothetical protein